MNFENYSFTRTYFEMIPVKLTFFELKLFSLVLFSISLCKSNSFHMMYLSVAICNRYYNIPLKHFPVKNYTRVKNSLQFMLVILTIYIVLYRI